MEKSLNAREPWLREIDLGVHPALAQPLFSLQQVREDLGKHTAELSDDDVRTPALAFHLRHLAGSTDRLTTYLLGRELDAEQLQALKQEKNPGPGRADLLAGIEASLQKAEAAIRELVPDDFGAPRYVGRQRIRTTAIGLAIHIAEHAQRHTGQILVLAALKRG